MSSKNTKGPKFRGAVAGYNKTDVDDYVARKESEVEIRERQQFELEKQLGDLKSEIDKLNAELESERAEKQKLLEECDSFKNTVEELEEQVHIANKENAKIKQENDELKESMDASGTNPKTIQDAILNAQRMSDILINEAHQKADEILEKAEADRQEREEAGRQVIAEAEQEAVKVTEEAEKKCDNLQQAYDRILLDVTQFKSELMGMYRRHMELLALLPEKEALEGNAEYIEVAIPSDDDDVYDVK